VARDRHRRLPGAGTIELGQLERTLARHQRLGIDTAPFIYLWERHPTYLTLAQVLFSYLKQPQAQGYTSIITLIEVCVQPQRRGRLDLVQAYQSALLHSEQVHTVPVDLPIADRAMALRAQYDIRMPDALQIATALESGATAFVTNDQRLIKVEDLDVLVLCEYLE
jgi:predicted nucleic acid-binding protein